MSLISFDYSTAQWVLSIIVGVCLTKVYNAVAHHIRHRKEIVFYVPYLLLIGYTFFILIQLWFTSPYFYKIVEGNKLAFLSRIIIDSMAVIFTLLTLPSEQMLSKSNLNLETIYQDSKKNWTVTILVWNFCLSIHLMTLQPDLFWVLFLLSGMVMMFVGVVLVLKFKNLYLHVAYQIWGISGMVLLILLPFEHYL